MAGAREAAHFLQFLSPPDVEAFYSGCARASERVGARTGRPKRNENGRGEHSQKDYNAPRCLFQRAATINLWGIMGAGRVLS